MKVLETQLEVSVGYITRSSKAPGPHTQRDIQQNSGSLCCQQQTVTWARALGSIRFKLLHRLSLNQPLLDQNQQMLQFPDLVLVVGCMLSLGLSWLPLSLPSWQSSSWLSFAR